MGFRKDFLWGGAVAAHQLEGAYDTRSHRAGGSRSWRIVFVRPKITNFP